MSKVETLSLILSFSCHVSFGMEDPMNDELTCPYFTCFTCHEWCLKYSDACFAHFLSYCFFILLRVCMWNPCCFHYETLILLMRATCYLVAY